MNAKDKANELYELFWDKIEDIKYGDWIDGRKECAKQCALICVEELFEFMKEDDLYSETASNANSKWVQYWNEVKDEINSL